MPKIFRTRRSRQDYAVIYAYIAEESPQNAEMIVRLFDEAIKILALHPFMGRPRHELDANVRSWVVHHFVIFYRPCEDGIELIRVLHGSMDIARHLFL